MIGIERIEYIEKKRFLYKNIFLVQFILMTLRSLFLTSIFYTDYVHFELLCWATDVQIHFKQNERREKLAKRSQKDFTQNVEKAAKW